MSEALKLASTSVQCNFFHDCEMQIIFREKLWPVRLDYTDATMCSPDLTPQAAQEFLCVYSKKNIGLWREGPVKN